MLIAIYCYSYVIIMCLIILKNYTGDEDMGKEVPKIMYNHS